MGLKRFIHLVSQTDYFHKYFKQEKSFGNKGQKVTSRQINMVVLMTKQFHINLVFDPSLVEKVMSEGSALNIHLSLDGVTGDVTASQIETTSPTRPKKGPGRPKKRGRRPKNKKQNLDKIQAIIKLFVENPQKKWKNSEIAEATRNTNTFVNNALSHLSKANIITRVAKGEYLMGEEYLAMTLDEVWAEAKPKL